MIETLIIYVVFLIVDIFLCLKRVPILGFVIAMLNILIVVGIMLPDSEFNIILTVSSALFAISTLMVNVLEYENKKR